MNPNRKQSHNTLIGSRKLHHLLNSIQQRLGLTHQQRKDQKKFEEAQLHFRDAQTLDQWWECVCRAAKAFDFSCVSLEIASRQDNTQNRIWKKDDNGSGEDINLENLLQMHIPIERKHSANPLQLEIRVKPNGSLEAAGNRIALFARLADEFGLNSLPDATDSQKKPIHQARIEQINPNSGSAILNTLGP